MVIVQWFAEYYFWAISTHKLIGAVYPVVWWWYRPYNFGRCTQKLVPENSFSLHAKRRTVSTLVENLNEASWHISRKKGCAKGGFLESLDRTNFTQHKFARASYGIKGRQPCSTPDNDHEELSPEEVRMLQLDPTAEKIYDKDLQRFLSKKMWTTGLRSWYVYPWISYFMDRQHFI